MVLIVPSRYSILADNREYLMEYINKIIHGDCLEKLKELPENSIDSIVTDPPYELGFMGKSWDNTGIANNVEMWREALRVLKPGGHLLAFSGTRTYHRMAVAIEDAGFEVRDMIEWVYGSGFPKSLNIGKAVNSLETNEWSKISKALDNIDQKSIMEVWKSNAKSAEIQLSKSITEVGNNTPKNYFVPDIAVLYLNQENKNASAIIADLNYCGLNHISEENTITVQGSAEQSIKLPPSLARYAVKLSPNQTALSWNIFIAQCDVKEWLKENTTVNLKVDEALKTLRGNKKYSNEEITSVLCAELTDILKLTILSQSNTFQNLDTKSQTDFLSAINVIITEYTAENLISNTVDILKSKAVDKLQGNEREVERNHIQSKTNPDIHAGGQVHITMPNSWEVTKGTSQYEGWGTALKPAHEPICMARKPLAEKTVAENVLKYGTGGINIDESRVFRDKDDKSGWSEAPGKASGFAPGDEEKMDYSKPREQKDDNPLGRFPANLILSADEDGQVSEEVRECFPETKSGKAGIRTSDGFNDGVYGKGMGIKAGQNNGEFGDSGNASRFFKSIPIEEQDEIQEECTDMEEKLEKLGFLPEAAKSIIYQAKASKSERNKGCEELPLGEAPGSKRSTPAEGRSSALGEPRANNHPTVKPIALMEYLIKMVTPKGGIVLDPFAGSGSTLIAAKQNGFNYVGIEMTEEYIPIINARLGL